MNIGYSVAPVYVRTLFGLITVTATVLTGTSALAQTVDFISADELLAGVPAIAVEPRVFGGSDCRLKTQAVHNGPGWIAVAYDVMKCNYINLQPVPRLYTPKGSFALVAVANAREGKTLSWPYGPRIDPIAGAPLVMKFKAPVEHLDAEAAASGVYRDLCVSFDCLNDQQGISKVSAYNTQAAIDTLLRSGVGGASPAGRAHPLTTMPPTRQGTHELEGGSMDAANLYFHGLRTITARDPKAKARLRDHLAGRNHYEAINLPDNPFDKDAYVRDLAAERAGFLDRLLMRATEPPPRAITVFAYAAIGDYDMTRQQLKFRSCHDTLPIIHNFTCAHSGVRLPLGGDTAITEEVLDIANKGPMVAAGRAVARKHQITRYGSNEAPQFTLGSFGLQHEFSAPVPRETMRMLFEIAKHTAIPDAARRDFGGKLLGLKLRIEDISPVSLTNASVYYTSRPVSFCLYDFAGLQPLYCADFGTK